MLTVIITNDTINWTFQNASVLMPQAFATYTATEGGEDDGDDGETPVLNDYKDANGLGGEYSFTFVMEFVLQFIPDAEGATTGYLVITDPFKAENSGTFTYEIVDGAYVINRDGAVAEGFSITTDSTSWLFLSPSISTAQAFTAYTGVGGNPDSGDSSDEGDGEEGGETVTPITGTVTYLSEKHGSGRYLMVVIDPVAGTMTLTRSDMTGNFGTGGQSVAEYTYAFDGTNVTVTKVSGTACTCVFDASGAPTSITWGSAAFVNFVAQVE